MSEETTNPETPTTTPIDLLNEDLSGVDTSLPIIIEGMYDLEVFSIAKEPSKDGAKENINLVLHTTETASTTTRDVVQKGFPIFHTISITPTEKYSVEQIKRKLAELTQAVGVRSINPLEAIKGRIVRTKIVIEPERTDKATGRTYEPRNAVRLFMKVS